MKPVNVKVRDFGVVAKLKAAPIPTPLVLFTYPYECGRYRQACASERGSSLLYNAVQ